MKTVLITGANRGIGLALTRHYTDRGDTVVAASPLGLELNGAPAFGALMLESRNDTEVDRNIPLVATKASVARDRYRGTTLRYSSSVRVHPAFLYAGHPLASVHGPFNAVTVESASIP